VSSKAPLDWMGTSHSGWRPIRQEVFLIQRDEKSTRVGSWQLVSAYPVKYEGPTLGGQANDVAIVVLQTYKGHLHWLVLDSFLLSIQRITASTSNAYKPI
jgi:hypothetical protein